MKVGMFLIETLWGTYSNSGSPRNLSQFLKKGNFFGNSFPFERKIFFWNKNL